MTRIKTVFRLRPMIEVTADVLLSVPGTCDACIGWRV